MGHEVQRVDNEHPERCQGSYLHGQCHNKRVENSVYCPIHQGLSGDKKLIQKNRAYNLGRWQQKVDNFTSHVDIKSLREEIGISRMMLETVLLRCTDANDLLVFSQQIGSIVNQIEKLVVSCNRLEEKTGVLYDKSQIAGMIDGIINVLTELIPDQELLNLIAVKIEAQLCSLFNLSQSNDSELGLNELPLQVLPIGQRNTG